jgi:hypothetical protein
MPGRLCAGDDVQGSVDPAVAAAVEGVPVGASGDHGDGRGAVPGREVVAGGEAPDITDLAEDAGRDDGADAVQLGEAGAGSRDRVLDLRGQLGDLLVEAGQAQEASAGDAGTDAMQALQEVLCDVQRAFPDEVGQAAPVAGQQDRQISVQPVGLGGASDDQLLAGIDQDFQVLVLALPAGRWQVGVAGGDPGDGQGVGGVGLARTAQPGPLATGQLRWDLPDVDVVLAQQPADPGPEVR